jgi:hypothetical protein
MAYSGGSLDLIRQWQEKGWINLRPGSGICELGAQEVNGDASDEQVWSFVNSFFPEAGDGAALQAELSRRAGPRCHMSSLCTAAGLRYLALDLDVRPGTVRFDLNQDRIEEQWRGAFDFTTTQGTIEHVVNQLNCLKVMHEVTAAGGTIMLNLPFAGGLNHGFFQYNPKFIVAMAAANSYSLLYLMLSGPNFHAQFGCNFELFDGDFHPNHGRIEGSANWGDQRLGTGGYIALLRKLTDGEFRFPTDYGSGTFDLLNQLP